MYKSCEYTELCIIPLQLHMFLCVDTLETAETESNLKSFTLYLNLFTFTL